MKNVFTGAFFSALIFFTLSTCSDPIFYVLSREHAPADPIISGSPTNFVYISPSMYVASGATLYKYDNNGTNRGTWTTMPSVEGDARFVSIAAAGNKLYALVLYDSDSSFSTGIVRLDNGSWSDSLTGNNGGYSSYQSIYSDNNNIYIGARGGNNSWAVLKISSHTGTNVIAPVSGLTGGSSFELKGVASDGANTLICTAGGIYLNEAPSPITGSADKWFAGILNLDSNKFAAITRGGNLHMVSSTSVESSAINIEDGIANYTGSLAVYRETAAASPVLLLAALQNVQTSTSSGYTSGYKEIQLTNNTPTGNFYFPGIGNVRTVDDNEVYTSSLGKRPISYIFQHPVELVLFASTQKDGVWSCRVRDGEKRWDAEE
ncbi:MAG: hypothetical protein FWB83_03240 [Treponema sp.]|nr:hypothetical protein [Treponema sp.]